MIEDVRPTTPTAGHFAKAVVGEKVTVRAAVFKDGHDQLTGRALLLMKGRKRPETAGLLTPRGNDEWEATLVPNRIGAHRIVVEAWTDRHATWAHKVRAKLNAGQPIDVEIAEGVELLRPHAGDPTVITALDALTDAALAPAVRVRPALAPEVEEVLWGPEGASDLTAAVPQLLWVDRERALVGAWYELFPRSFGGLKGTARPRTRLARLGFDVLYLPPIHPIGTTARKGPNNTLTASDDDPGSPWAIGSHQGGHTAINPDLGSIEDFSYLVEEVRAHGMELALDYALQCSPTTPGSAITPNGFITGPTAASPTPRIRRRCTRTSCPSTSGRPWSLTGWRCGRRARRSLTTGSATVSSSSGWTTPTPSRGLLGVADHLHPGEASGGAVPLGGVHAARVMARLAEAGFSQSYTYFTWRTAQHGPEGLWAYLEELAHGPVADYMRPNFWPNTPDILSGPLRLGPPAAFALRLVLAATMSPSYGVYSGYELYENVPASDSNEEYLHSEKYEIKDRDYSRPDSLAPLMMSLNHVRRRHPALQRLRSIHFHSTTNPSIIAYSKVSDDGDDAVLDGGQPRSAPGPGRLAAA